MLETIHEYARERLEDSGEAEAMRRRHTEYFTAMAEQAEPHTRGGPNQIRWLRRLEADHENLQTARRWSVEADELELELRLVGALGYFWWRQGHYAEGKEWTERALRIAELAPPDVRASVYSTAGRVFFYLDDIASCRKVLRQALAVYRELGDRREVGWTLVHLMMPSAGKRDEFMEAAANCEEGLALLREAGDQSGIAQGLTNLGEHARLNGDFQLARDAYEEALTLSRETGDALRESILMINLAFILLHEGSAENAEGLLRESLSLALAFGHTAYTADKLSALAGAAVALGHPERATVLSGAAEALYERQGYEPQAYDIPEFDRYQSSAREQLDDETFEAAWAEGRAMNLEEAIAYALEESGSY
jgi:non-specific serine/threonine protein kinase